MQFGKEDITGIEILLVHSRFGYYAVIQCAEGAPGVPIVLPAKVSGNVVEIAAPAKDDIRSGCPASSFRGTFGETGLTGSFEGTQWPGFLKRTNSYWQ